MASDEPQYGKREQTLAQRMTDQAIGSFLAVTLGTVVGWLWGLGDLKRDVVEQGKSIIKIEKAVDIGQKDISDLKMNGFRADSELDKRVSVMESQHNEIIRRVGVNGAKGR